MVTRVLLGASRPAELAEVGRLLTSQGFEVHVAPWAEFRSAQNERGGQAPVCEGPSMGTGCVCVVHSDDAAEALAFFGASGAAVVVIGEDPAAVYEAMRCGARHVLVWPPGPPELVVHVIAHAADHARLTQQANMFETLVSNIDEGMWMWWPESQRFYASPRLADIFGNSVATLFGKDGLRAVVHPEDRPKLDTVLEKVRSGQFDDSRQILEVRIHHPERGLRWVRDTSYPVRDERRRVLCFCGYTEDITEERHVAQRLLRYRKVYENTHDGILIVGTDGRILDYNPALADYAGLGPDALGQLPEMTKMNTGSRGAVEKALAECSHFREVIEMTGDDGILVSIDLAVFPIFDDDDNHLGFGFVGRNVTDIRRAFHELKKASKELRHAQTQLIQSEKMASLGTMVAGIAHEINTPMGAIASMHDTLIRAVERIKSLPTESTEAVQAKRARLLKLIDEANQTMKTGTERVTTIIRRLKSFARLDEAELKDADIHEGIEDTLLLMHHELKHGITVVREFGDVPLLACYPGRLNQVFLNILMNARHAIEHQGEIHIRTSVTPDNYVRVAFTDTGSGIPPENIARIFDPGFTTKGVGIGMGLGLSICYQIVQDHLGRIEVDSTPGKGTTFTVLLPRDLESRLAEMTPSPLRRNHTPPAPLKMA